MFKNLPKLGSMVKYKGKEYSVYALHVLKQSVSLKIDKDTSVEVPICELGK